MTREGSIDFYGSAFYSHKSIIHQSVEYLSESFLVAEKFFRINLSLCSFFCNWCKLRFQPNFLLEKFYIKIFFTTVPWLDRKVIFVSQIDFFAICTKKTLLQIVEYEFPAEPKTVNQ